MIKNIVTLADLKEFISSLNEEQLKQPVRICEEDKSAIEMWQGEILESDMINPTGEGAEPITDYLESPDYDDIVTSEPTVAKKGEIYFYAVK